MKGLKKLAAAALALTMSIALVACGGAGASNAGTTSGSTSTGGATGELPVLRVAAMPFITSLPTRYIQEHKLDEKAGFKMEITMFATGAPMNEALAADLWDVGAMGAAAVTGVANYDMMIIGEVLESTDGLAVFVQPDSPIAAVEGYNPSFPTVKGDPETVKGATILLPIGTAQHFTALKWLEKIGLKPTDVNIVNMESAQALQSLQAGQADGAALNVPTFFEAKEAGMVDVANLAEMGTRYVDMVVANRKAVEGKADIVQKYIDCILEATEALTADPAMAADLMMEFLKENGAETSRESVEGDISRVKFLTKEDWKGRDLGNFAKELGEFYIDQGQLEPDLIEKFNTNIDTQFVKSYQ